MRNVQFKISISIPGLFPTSVSFSNFLYLSYLLSFYPVYERTYVQQGELLPTHGISKLVHV